jgi:hypothetical protein
MTTDSLIDAAADLLKLLPSLAALPDPAVAIGKYTYTPLDIGLDKFICLWPGQVTQAKVDGEIEWREWDILFDVAARIIDKSEKPFSDFREEVIQFLRLYPTLNDAVPGVTGSDFETIDDPMWVYDRAGAGPFFTMQRFRWSFMVIATLSGGEY